VTHKLGHGPAPMRPPRLRQGQKPLYFVLEMRDIEGYPVESTTHLHRDGAEVRRAAQMRTKRFGAGIIKAVWE
jgi:hypothetical protein